MNKAVRKAQRELDHRTERKHTPRRIRRAELRLERRVIAYESRR